MFVAGGPWFAHAVPGKVWSPATGNGQNGPPLHCWHSESVESIARQIQNLAGVTACEVRGFSLQKITNLFTRAAWITLNEACASLPSLGTMQQDPHDACSWCWVNLLFFCIFSCLPPCSVIYDALPLVLSLEFSILFYSNTPHLQHHMGALSTSPPDSEAAVIFINRSQSKFLRC